MTTPPEQSTEDGECQHGVMRRYYECPQCDTPARTLLQRAAIALPVLRDVLNAASLQGGDVADKLLSDINKELSKPEQPNDDDRFSAQLSVANLVKNGAAPDPQPFFGVDEGGKDESATVDVTAPDPQVATPRTDAWQDADWEICGNATEKDYKRAMLAYSHCREIEREAAALRRRVEELEVFNHKVICRRSPWDYTCQELKQKLAAEVEARRAAEEAHRVAIDELLSANRDVNEACMREAVRAEQAEAKAREDAKDAARYRWLRTSCSETDGEFFIGVDSVKHVDAWALQLEDADSAIDAAITERGKG